MCCAFADWGLQSAYTQHVLQNVHEYRTLTDTMMLFKATHMTTMLIPYEQLLIQTFHHNGNLIPEQNPCEQNQLFHLVIDTSSMSQPAQN